MSGLEEVADGVTNFTIRVRAVDPAVGIPDRTEMGGPFCEVLAWF